jgi:hypothetical protein
VALLENQGPGRQGKEVVFVYFTSSTTVVHSSGISAGRLSIGLAPMTGARFESAIRAFYFDDASATRIVVR